MSESIRRSLLEQLKVTGNDICADCNQEGPEWASVTLGIFLCTQCARKIGSHISRIKSLKLDNWDQSNLIVMEENGNLKSKSFYEKFVPHFYRKPRSDDSHVVREQWIRAKYERKEFVEPFKMDYIGSCKEGFLWKKGKEDDKFQLRKFVLSDAEGSLKYFVKPTQKVPKTTIKIEHLNMTFCPNKIGNSNGLQLSWLKDGYTRSIFVYHEEGKILIEWYTAIRAVKLHHQQIAFPETPIEELKKYLTRDFIKEDYLWKTGPRASDCYRKRWFILDERKFMYFEHPLDAYPKGEIFLGESNEGYSVNLGVATGMRQLEQGYSFTLVTPDRNWLLAASSAEERDSWIKTLESVIHRPPAPHNYDDTTKSALRNSYERKSRSSNAFRKGKNILFNSF